MVWPFTRPKFTFLLLLFVSNHLLFFSSLPPSPTHSGAYLLMSAGMIIVAYLGIIPLTYTLPYLAYTLLFTFICTHAILSWSFPLSLGSGSNLITHDYNSFPFLFTFLYLLIAALLTLRSSTPPIGHRCLLIIYPSQTHIVTLFCLIPHIPLLLPVFYPGPQIYLSLTFLSQIIHLYPPPTPLYPTPVPHPYTLPPSHNHTLYYTSTVAMRSRALLIWYSPPLYT